MEPYLYNQLKSLPQSLNNPPYYMDLNNMRCRLDFI